jgi:hypothetical protein
MRLSAPFFSQTPHKPSFTPLLPLLSCKPSTWEMQQQQAGQHTGRELSSDTAVTTALSAYQAIQKTEECMLQCVPSRVTAMSAPTIRRV